MSKLQSTQRAELRVRAAEPEDAAAIAGINTASWRAAYAGVLSDEVLADLAPEGLEPLWRAYIVTADLPDERLWVVGEPLVFGYARTGPSRDDDEALRLTGEIYGLYVDPPAWHRGAGRALMGHIVEDFAARGFEHATLWVAALNERARGFYERMGWVPDGRDDKPFHGAPQLRYRVDLTTQQ